MLLSNMIILFIYSKNIYQVGRSDFLFKSDILNKVFRLMGMWLIVIFALTNIDFSTIDSIGMIISLILVIAFIVTITIIDIIKITQKTK